MGNVMALFTVKIAVMVHQNKVRGNVYTQTTSRCEFQLKFKAI
ncbi:hypothetical protein PTD2_18135 [Pseudoalteromonas tunicata D2]|uniref:Uncharacterized protein n=1 Tax=Pseudoalteromonas tunicata D2 TaxID=87626 RepID=A4CBN0_9GAMM|nr:hypothetical protein PTD2_18135 [Pseudoalteromonas tunicata D2]